MIGLHTSIYSKYESESKKSIVVSATRGMVDHGGVSPGLGLIGGVGKERGGAKIGKRGVVWLNA